MPRSCLTTTGRVHTLPLLLGLLFVSSATAAESPRLLITADDIPRLQHACGLNTPQDAPQAWGKFARNSEDFQALREHINQHVGTVALPGEVLAAAFLHLIAPDSEFDPKCVNLVSESLAHPSWFTTDPLELVIAMDWCWDAIEPRIRSEFLLAMRQQAAPFTPQDSPLQPGLFRTRLAALALALAVDSDRADSPSWNDLRQRLLDAGMRYCSRTLPRFIAWRGLSPTGPGSAAREECDTALALEIARMFQPDDPWERQRNTVGRWLEHYVVARLPHPRLNHHFIRDDARTAPLTPVPDQRDLLPLTAHLIAARTHDSTATLVAQRVAADLRSSTDPLSVVWRWIPIIFELDPAAAADPNKLPHARNFGGAVMFRAGAGPQTTGIWIEAAQPFLRRRQHFDAGHFIIYRAGHLAIGGGDDIVFEAVPSKGGEQHLGTERDPFDFEQYFTSTIAHNCLVLWDAARISRWYGAIYQPAGGQRPIENTCTDFAQPLDKQERQTGTMLAYGQHRGAGYLALDLSPAYPKRAISQYTREFIFCCERVLVVVDRVDLPSSRSVPTWILNIPTRPSVDGDDLRTDQRVAGDNNQAGVWRLDQARWLRWTDGDGALWLTTLMPQTHLIRAVGGPAEVLRVPRGDGALRPYIGGSANSFERLIIPAERHAAYNTWYRLGEPTLLGSTVGQTSQWGRIEIEPAERSTRLLFLTVLVTAPSDDRETPTVTFSRDADTIALSMQIASQEALLTLGAQTVGGQLEISAPQAFTWTLPDQIVPDPPLETQSPADSSR